MGESGRHADAREAHSPNVPCCVAFGFARQADDGRPRPLAMETPAGERHDWLKSYACNAATWRLVLRIIWVNRNRIDPSSADFWPRTVVWCDSPM
jgi:hypothetical protein